VPAGAGAAGTPVVAGAAQPPSKPPVVSAAVAAKVFNLLRAIMVLRVSGRFVSRAIPNS
jgi:hypothetical protein